MESQAVNIKETSFIDDTILKESIFIGLGGEEDRVICSTQVLLSPGNGKNGILVM